MKGIIYCIKEKISDELLYIGSTKMTLKQRIKEHRRDCFIRIKNAPIYQYIRQKSDKDCFSDNFIFEVISEREYESRQELYKDERHWLDKLNPSLNKNRPFRSKQEKKQQMHEWYLNHVDSENERLNSLPKHKSQACS